MTSCVAVKSGMRSLVRPRSMVIASIAAVGLIVSPAPAAANEAGLGAVTAAWQLTPSIDLSLLLVGWIYAAGWWRAPGDAAHRRQSRHVSFFAGLSLIYLALQSPLDVLSEHFFFVHQIQHLLLLDIVPILLLLSAPQGRMIAGLPRRVREHALAPLLRSGFVRGCFSVLSHPATATFLFCGMICVWNWPSIHDAALRDERVHYLMHVTILVSGLLFWWRILDRRAPRAASFYAVRLVMLKISMMAAAFVGGYLTMKQAVLYDVYDQLGLGLTAATDETLGGFILWIPGCIPAVIVGALLLRRWYQHDSGAVVSRAAAVQDTPACAPRQYAGSVAFSPPVSDPMTGS